MSKIECFSTDSPRTKESDKPHPKPPSKPPLSIKCLEKKIGSSQKHSEGRTYWKPDDIVMAPSVKCCRKTTDLQLQVLKGKIDTLEGKIQLAEKKFSPRQAGRRTEKIMVGCCANGSSSRCMSAVYQKSRSSMSTMAEVDPSGDITDSQATSYGISNGEFLSQSERKCSEENSSNSESLGSKDTVKDLSCLRKKPPIPLGKKMKIIEEMKQAWEEYIQLVIQLVCPSKEETV